MLSDYISNNLKIIFVGYNPGKRSNLLGQHYAGHGNQFYKLLYESGLTSKFYEPKDAEILLSEGYGLTNLVSRWTRSSSDLSPEEMSEGAQILKEKILKYLPSVVCFLGKDIYRSYVNIKSSVHIDYGPVTFQVISGVIDFVAPNPSARSTIPYAQKLEVFKSLLKII